MRAFASLVILMSFVGPALSQSLWDPRRPVAPLHADTTARRVGDIVTVVIQESQVVESDESTTLEKESSLSALLSNFDILPRFFDPLPRVEGTQSSAFDGRATYDKDNVFRTRLSAIVIDVLPNGNLLIEGIRRIVTDGEEKVIRMTGLIRPYDIDSTNMVRSEFVANASISYEGAGPLTRATNRGWFSKLLDIVWPF